MATAAPVPQLSAMLTYHSPDSGGGRIHAWEGMMVQRITDWIDRVFYRFSRTTETRRAAILGAGFGLLMCVVVMLICVIFGFIGTLGE
jgi:hypothetical protein